MPYCAHCKIILISIQIHRASKLNLLKKYFHTCVLINGKRASIVSYVIQCVALQYKTTLSGCAYYHYPHFVYCLRLLDRVSRLTALKSNIHDFEFEQLD